MGELLESKSEILVHKLYASAVIDSTTEPDPYSDPGTSGGQILRHIDHNLNAAMDQFRPNEKRGDNQRPMGFAGTTVLSGTINGFLSPGTHANLFRGVMRNDWTAAVSKTEAELTSIAMSASASTITFGGGDPVSEGFKVGMLVAASSITGLNLNKRFVILSFGGSSNRTLTVYPAPLEDLGADTSFTFASVGKTIDNPSTPSGLTNYKHAFEWYNGGGADFSRFAKECRIGGFDLSAPVNDNVRLNFNVMGRGRRIFDGTDAPFFTAPSAETTTDIPSSMQGLVRLNGSTLAVTTTSSLKANLNPQAAKVRNAAGLVAGIMLEDFMADGGFTAFLDGSTLFDAYDNKTEMEYFEYYPSTGADASPGVVFYLPRIRLTACEEVTVDGAKAAQCTFEAARYVGSGAGIASTTLQIADSNAT